MAENFLLEEMRRLKEEGLYRWLRTVEGEQGARMIVDGREVVMLASSNYLGLATHPRVVGTAREATEKYGCSLSASRLISGNSSLYVELEEALARFKGTEAALVFSTGYMANLGVISALATSEDRILCDAKSHASIFDAARLTGARLKPFPHNDVDALERLLRREATSRRTLVVVEGVYSMDGDVAPLAEIIPLARRYGALTVVDDSHGTGVLGPTGAGAVEEAGLTGQVDIEVGTLGKALGGFGAYVAGSRTLVEYLINRSRTFIFTCALPPAVLAAGREALAVVREEPEIRARLWGNVEYFRRGVLDQGWDILASRTQIFPLLVGGRGRVMEVSERLLARGVFIQGIRYPSVPKGTERLRATVSACHSREDLDVALAALAEVRTSLATAEA